MRLKLTLLVGVLAGTIASLSPAAMAQSSSGTSSQVPQPDPSGVNWKGVGIGAGTIAGNVLYIPAKLVYGILGGIGGGAGYALTGGNTQVANTIWRSSLGGDYVLTPDMVAGKQPVHFSGPTQTAQLSSSAANVSSAPPTFASAAGPTGSAAGPDAMPHPIDSGAGPLGSGAPLHSEMMGGTSPASPNAGYAVGSSAKSAASSDSSIE